MPYDANYFEQWPYALGYNQKVLGPYMKRRLDIIRSFCPAGRLLDVGCAYGLFMKYAQSAFDTYGIDISEHAVEKAKEMGNKKVFRIDIERDKLPFKKHFFDVITLLDVLEHLDNPGKSLDKLRPLLKDGGVLVISVPNKLYKLFNHDPTHKTFFSKKELSVLLEKNGFELVYSAGRWGTNVFGLFLFSNKLIEYASSFFIIARKRGTFGRD